MKTSPPLLFSFSPLLFLILAALACQSLPSTTSEFEGTYSSGFEVSSFVPCDYSDEAGYGMGYWLTGTTEFYDQYYALVESSGFDPATGYLSV